MIIESTTMKRISIYRTSPRERINGERFLQEVYRTYLGVTVGKRSVEPALMVLKRIVDESMINKGGTAEFFGPLWGWKCLAFFIPYKIKIDRREKL